MLNLPIHQHGMCLYLLRSHLISLMNILYFSVHRVGIFCEMTKYFILEGAIVIGIHFKCWFSMFITRIYNYFCVLTLCLVFLLSSLINSSRRVVESIGLPPSTLSCLLETKTVLLLPFKSGCLLFLFLALLH